MRYRILADGILSLGPLIATGQRWNRTSEDILNMTALNGRKNVRPTLL
jgi:hypothetical protein